MDRIINNSRNEAMDLLKGISIISVVLFHITFFYTGGIEIRNYVTPFFMSLFFFASGFFYSPKKSFLQFIVHKINRLIIPLIFFYFLNYFIGFISSKVLNISGADEFSFKVIFDLFNGHEHFTYSGALWFLNCLFNVYLIYYFIDKIKNLKIKAIVAFLLTLLGFLLSKQGINIPYFIDSALSMILFFFLGNYCHRLDFFIMEKKSDGVLGVVLLVLYIIFINIFPHIDSEIMSNIFSGNFFEIIIVAALGISALYFICKWVKKISFINFYGQNSLIILVTHQLAIVACKVLISKIISGADGILFIVTNLVLVLFIEYFIITFLNKCLPYFVGKRDLFQLKESKLI